MVRPAIDPMPLAPSRPGPYAQTAVNVATGIGMGGRTAANLIVSNGRDVTVADSKGRFHLPFWGTHVYCVAPPGYSPFDGAIMPLATPDQRYDILPTRCEPPAGEFVFAQLADCHVTVPGVDGSAGRGSSPADFEAALRQVKAEANADFVMLTGDQVEIGTVNELQLVRAVLARVGLPVVQANGNHEGQCNITDRSQIPGVDPAALAPDERIEGFYSIFGPTRFAFFWGQYLFLVLDSMSSFAPDQHQWIELLLDCVPPETPLVVAIHHPDMAFWWFPELFDRNVQLVISGHYHRPQAFWQDGVLHSSAPCTLMVGDEGFPPSYRTYRMPVPGQGRITWQTTNVNRDPSWRRILIKQIEWAHETIETGSLEVCWRRKLDGAVKSSSPMIADGRIVVAPHDLDEEPVGRLQVFDVTTGELLWAKRLGDGFMETPAVGAGWVAEIDSARRAVWYSATSDGGSRLRATCGSYLYGQSTTGQIYCISLARGRILWQQDLGPRAGRCCTSRVVIAENLVLVGDSRCFAAFDRYVGQLQWIWPEDRLARAGSFYTAGTAAGDGVILAGSAYENDGVLALDVHTGKLRWRSGDRQHARYGHCVFDKQFFFSGPSDLICLEATTGTLVWMAPCDPWSYPKPLVHQGRVFIAGSGGSLQAIDRHSGYQLWRTSFGPPVLPLLHNAAEPGGQLAAPVACGDHVLLASNDGHLYVVEADTGRIVCKHDFGIPLSSEPVVCGGYLIMTTPDATLWKFTMRSLFRPGGTIAAPKG